MEISLAETCGPVRRSNLVKMQVYRIDSNGQPVIGESEQLCRKAPGERRIVDTFSHSKGIRKKKTEMFSLSSYKDIVHLYTRLIRPHIELVTMARTGTHQPPSCRRRPKAVGQSVMELPWNPYSLPPSTSGWPIREATEKYGDRASVVVRDGNTDHMAKGCRLGWLPKLHTLEITPCH